MSHPVRRRTAALLGTVCLGLLGQAALADAASAVTVTKAELKGGQLRLEGHAAPGIFVTATSATSSAGARADQNGLYKIQAASYTAPDCTVTIADRQTPTATVTLSGCTRSVTPVPATPAPPTGSCVITPEPPITLTTGASAVVNFLTTGCNDGVASAPLRWSVVAGVIPTGMTGPNFQGTTAANLIGTPGLSGSYRFTLQVTDQLGATDQENFTITVT